jgi:hypothetical protein
MGRYIILAVLVANCASRAAHAQTARPYDGIDAGIDAYNRAEEQRRFTVSQQRALNEDLRARSYLPPGPVMYYGPSIGYGYSSGYSNYGYAGSSYGYTRRWPLGYRRYEERVVARPIVPTVVWPNRYYGINSYTYPFKLPVRQPVGQQQIQTGPNRWESHPVYAEPLPKYPVTPPIENDPLELRARPGSIPETPVRAPREF